MKKKKPVNPLARTWLRREADPKNYNGLDPEALAFLQKFNSETIEGAFGDKPLITDKSLIYAEQYANKNDLLTNGLKPFIKKDITTPEDRAKRLPVYSKGKQIDAIDNPQDFIIEHFDRTRRAERIRIREFEGYPRLIRKRTKKSPLAIEATLKGASKTRTPKGSK